MILINPPQATKYPQPPLGLASLAAVLERNGYNVEILDANALRLPEDEVVKKAGGEDVIGITAMTPTINSAIRIARGIKQDNPDSTISYRNDGTIKNTPSRAPIMDLDSLPFLAYHLLPLGKYKLHPPHGREYPFMAMLTSRGCPYNCIFCSKSVFGSTYRGQSPERIVDEIVYLKERFGII